jgi:histidinol-phosphate aminotransferase
LEHLASPCLSGPIPNSLGKPTQEVERAFGISRSVKRAYLVDRFQERELTGTPTMVNFLLVDVRRPGGQMTEAFLQREIVRLVARHGFRTALRMTVGTAGEDEKCVAARRPVLAS